MSIAALSASINQTIACKTAVREIRSFNVGLLTTRPKPVVLLTAQVRSKISLTATRPFQSCGADCVIPETCRSFNLPQGRRSRFGSAWLSRRPLPERIASAAFRHGG
jgi:hypothetical protein